MKKILYTIAFFAFANCSLFSQVFNCSDGGIEFHSFSCDNETMTFKVTSFNLTSATSVMNIPTNSTIVHPNGRQYFGERIQIQDGTWMVTANITGCVPP